MGSETDSFYNYISDPELRDYLKKFIENKFQLKQGQEAPDFYLKDSLGNAFTLNNFQGKLVYLFFWGSGCKPCQKELEQLNDLLLKLDESQVQVVTICSDRNEDTWKYILKEYKPDCLNLWAKGNWGKLLGDKYDIQGSPHFCLIDRNGKVIENKCSRLSQGGISLIKKNL